MEGFLLSRQWRDTATGVELEFWFSTGSGPLRVVLPRQSSVFFLQQGDIDRARSVLGEQPGWRPQPLDLLDFSMQPVSACYFDSHRQARRAAQQLTDAGLVPLEADINPADRFLMERFVTGGARIHGKARPRGGFLEMIGAELRGGDYRPELRVVSFDIETAMRGLELYSIAAVGEAGGEQVRRVFMVGEGADQDYVISCSDQREALTAFLRWIESFDPDVLIGWNVVNFDAWYLQRLADQLGVGLRLGRAGGGIYWRALDDGERHTARLGGRVLLDGIELLKAAFYRFESYSLENVSRELLGTGKLLKGSGRGVEIESLFRTDKAALARYNLRDCELVSEVFRHAGLLDFAVARSAMTGLALDRMGGSVASFDNLYLPRLHRRGYVAPNASSDQQASPGGFVLESLPGLYDHVLVLDFKSLYPSIIRTFHIDPLGLALGLAGHDDAAACIPGFLGARFAREGAILPELINVLWRRRDEARNADDRALSQAIKIIMNSFYGVLGSPGCRFFDARLATSITRRGHDILKRTRDRIETLGHRVIYGDTDSVFVWIRDAGCDADAVAAGEQLESELNTWWNDVLRREFNLASGLELQFETHFRRFLMPTVRGSDKGSKKRYAGVVAAAGGERVVFKGLENVRTDWTRLARGFQEELYRRVFLHQPFEDYIRQQVGALLAGEMDTELVYRKRLRRRLDEYQRAVPPHVQAARLGRERDLPVTSRGDWVEYVITTMGPEPADCAQAPLDYQHYVDRQLQPVADGILGFVGTSFDAITGRQIDLF